MITVAGRRSNGRPAFRPYTRGAPRPAWMTAALAAAEAQHGPPVPTCICGHPITFGRGNPCVTCPACGWRTGSRIQPRAGAS